MKKFNEYHKELQFIAEDLAEWGEGNTAEKVYYNAYQFSFITGDNRFKEFDFNHNKQIPFRTSRAQFTKQEWQEARNAYLREQEEDDTPKVGDLVNVYDDGGDLCHVGCELLYVGDQIWLLKVSESEMAYSKFLYSIRYHKPEPNIQDQMMDDWKSASLDNAYDEVTSAVAIGRVFKALANAGWKKDAGDE